MVYPQSRYRSPPTSTPGARCAPSNPHSHATPVGVVPTQLLWLHKQLQGPHDVCGSLQGQGGGQGMRGLSTAQPHSLQSHWPQERAHSSCRLPQCPEPALAQCGGCTAPNTTEESWLMFRQQALLCETGKEAQQQELLPSCQYCVCRLRSFRAGTSPSRAETPISNPAAVPPPPVSRPSKGRRYPRQSCTPNISLQRKSHEHTLGTPPAAATPQHSTVQVWALDVSTRTDSLAGRRADTSTMCWGSRCCQIAGTWVLWLMAVSWRPTVSGFSHCHNRGHDPRVLQD